LAAITISKTDGQPEAIASARAPRQPKGVQNDMAKMKSLEDLFIHLLKDMYYAEKQILKALPKMAAKADSMDLRKAFEHHLKETEGQVDRLEKVFALCDRKAVGETCPAIKGILEEGKELMQDADDPDVLDAGMIADAQAVEHYEISRYGTLIAWAKQLGMSDAASLLSQTLEQEYNADKSLTKLAESRLNREAA
jgi:ferritin-like metal-binding protein YciE